MHHAAGSYSEMPRLTELAEEIDEGDAFVRKDYDQVLGDHGEIGAGNPKSPAYWGELASALACKYAVTGNIGWRQKAEETLEKSRQLSQGSPEAIKPTRNTRNAFATGWIPGRSSIGPSMIAGSGPVRAAKH